MATKAGKRSKVTARKTAPATATKTPAARKSATATATKTKSRSAASRISKGDAFSCDICGLQVYVDELGEVLETTALYCCEEPMKKTSASRGTKK